MNHSLFAEDKLLFVDRLPGSRVKLLNIPQGHVVLPDAVEPPTILREDVVFFAGLLNPLQHQINPSKAACRAGDSAAGRVRRSAARE